eukprot:CAMPEP_0174267640 /NCGR_PEP_ID=MMETSP0439-20130205/34392_1 /TAXON_ID=0 /ORGANISM="Stereomyxa ramosa, Strain Chinc5" /LENGTH=279 /DNA_ID=CAMNT_0015355253 /DNA_START=287 /DNA_END=1126 /DNA_ORIENTATION=+
MIGIAVPFGLYYVYHIDYVPITGRMRMMDVSVETERMLGEATWTNVKRAYNGLIVADDHEVVQLVKQLAKKLILCSDAPQQHWEVIVIDSPEQNAFAIPGGKIAVFTGMLKIVDIEGLAVILSHEIGHVVARHSAETHSKGRLSMLASLVASFLTNVPMGLTEKGFSVGFTLPFSRKLESEADYIGLLILTRAGFPPEAATALWRRLDAMTESEPMTFVSTHPKNARRAQNLEKWIPEILQLASSYSPALPLLPSSSSLQPHHLLVDPQHDDDDDDFWA